MTTSVYHARLACPHCGKAVDLGSGLISASNRAPRCGDFCVCASCGVMLTFVAPDSLTVLTPEAFDSLPERLRAELYAASGHARRGASTRFNN